MTERNRQLLLFSSLGRQEIEADFAGGTRTSDAGGLLPREVDRRLGLLDARAACLTGPRQKHNFKPRSPGRVSRCDTELWGGL